MKNLTVSAAILLSLFPPAAPARHLLLNWSAESPSRSPFPSIGKKGGDLRFGQRTEPKTLNPVVAIDSSSKRILGLLNADLIHINSKTQATEPSLAQSWVASPDKREYTLTLRSGLRFSDGAPCSIDDVIFTFKVYLDEKTNSPQRDLLVVNGKPVEVRQVGPYAVRFSLSAPYAAAERMFDSVFILPKHLLEKAYLSGAISKMWPLTTPPGDMAGLGPFRLKQYVPGERLVLERNPYYWKRDPMGNPLPYLDTVSAAFTGGDQGEAMRLASGEIDVADRLSPGDFVTLNRYANSRRMRLLDLGPGLDFSFLFFNLNGDKSTRSTLPDADVERSFRDIAFRRAVSTAIDRQALVRLAYSNRAYPLASFVPPGDARWVDTDLPALPYSKEGARAILRDAGFKWDREGRLLTVHGNPLRFSLISSASNPQLQAMATLIQQDLDGIGIGVNVVSLEFHSLLDRIFRTFDYEAAIMTLAGGDTDPTSEMNIWTSEGGTHVWDLTGALAGTSWQSEINRLMHQQMVTPEYRERKLLYNRVQELVVQNLPIVCLLSPHVLVGAKENVANFDPVILGDHTLWNAEQLYILRK